jgi:hypothetical protein
MRQTRVVGFLVYAGDRADSGLACQCCGGGLLSLFHLCVLPEGWTDRGFALAEVFTTDSYLVIPIDTVFLPVCL